MKYSKLFERLCERKYSRKRSVGRKTRRGMGKEYGLLDLAKLAQGMSAVTEAPRH
jgi:hypothetical protein